jgi:hypothetical protein
MLQKTRIWLAIIERAATSKQIGNKCHYVVL